MYVVNGISADYLIVFAVTNNSNNEESSEVSITAFLVEKDMPGVSWRKLDGSRNEIAQVTFQNTQIPVGMFVLDFMLQFIIVSFRKCYWSNP